MRVVYLTTRDPLYLPALFKRVLADRSADAARVYAVPPLYKNQTTRAATWRYLRTFGPRATVELARRTLGARARGNSIAAVCRRLGVRYSDAADVNDPSLLNALREFGPEVIVSLSCPQIFRRPLLELPLLGCLNVHGAILPQYRGIMPSFWMLANGETRAGVSIYFMNEQIDAGDLCGQRVFEILPDETLHEFLVRSKRIAAEVLLEALDGLERGALRRTLIDLSQGSYYTWPDRAAVAAFRSTGHRLW